jgi:hypothetical protein
MQAAPHGWSISRIALAATLCLLKCAMVALPSPEELPARTDGEIARWAPVIKAASVKAN